jgi:putative tryptophan/tyrosine transport system substrate-binding protein
MVDPPYRPGMDRRRFLLTSLAGAVAAPLAAGAQQAARVPHLGVLVVGSPETTSSEIEAFRQGLRDLGYVEGQSIAVDYRYHYGTSAGVPEVVAEFIRLKVNIIVAAGGPIALAAKNATQTTPIVFVAAGDPVAYGIVASLARPGGNVTGLSLIIDADFIGKWIQLLKEAAPTAARIWFIQDSNMPRPMPPAARQLNIHYIEVRNLHDIDSVFAEAGKKSASVIIPPQPFFFTSRAEITALAAKHRVPAIYGFRTFVDAGGLMSYGLSLPGVWRQAATYVDKILKGAKPGDMPVEQPTKFELVINLKTAKALGLTIPPSLLARADQVIE